MCCLGDCHRRLLSLSHTRSAFILLPWHHSRLRYLCLFRWLFKFAKPLPRLQIAVAPCTFAFAGSAVRGWRQRLFHHVYHLPLLDYVYCRSIFTPHLTCLKSKLCLWLKAIHVSWNSLKNVFPSTVIPWLLMRQAKPPMEVSYFISGSSPQYIMGYTIESNIVVVKSKVTVCITACGMSWTSEHLDRFVMLLNRRSLFAVYRQWGCEQKVRVQAVMRVWIE